jgi:hypothetical protein
LGSLRFDGISFSVYVHDHPPCHVHGKVNGVVVIIEFRNGRAVVAHRRNPIRPANAKRSDVKKILQAAADNAELLIALWESTHG